MKEMLKRVLQVNVNEEARNDFLKKELSKLPNGYKILDAGAGELKNKKYCQHLNYTSQDICEYDGVGDDVGLHMGEWNTDNIDLVCDIVNMPIADDSFDAVICSEVFEHMQDPALAIVEFSRVIKDNGILILTAPFSSLVHFAPHYYCTGFSSYWYKHHLEKNNFEITSIQANGDWFSLMKQEILRIPKECYKSNKLLVPFAVLLSLLYVFLFKFINSGAQKIDIACFGYFVVARKVK